LIESTYIHKQRQPLYSIPPTDNGHIKPKALAADLIDLVPPP
jgi:hypothetical protein